MKSLTYVGYVNCKEGVPVGSFINVAEATLGKYPRNTKETSTFLKLPTQEEIYPYKEAVKDYLKCYGIPAGETVADHFEKPEVMNDFRTFYDDMCIDRILYWCFEKLEVA